MFTIPDRDEATFPEQSGIYQTDIDIIVAGEAGTGVITGCAVTAQGSPNMTVAVASGAVKIGGVIVAVTGANVTITAAHSTLKRFDLIVVNSSGVLSAVAGTASAATTADRLEVPDIPASSVALAVVFVPAADTAINSNQIVDKRVQVNASPTVVEQTPPTFPSSGYGTLYASDAMIAGRGDDGADIFGDFRRVRGKELTQWRSALANRELSPANIYCVGDSMTEGYGQSTFAKTWFDIFRDSLQREYRNGGEGFNGVTLNLVGGGTTTFPHPWTIAGTPTSTDFGWGFGRRAIILDSTDDILTRSFYGDRVYILYTTSSATGTMKVTIDSGTPVTQSTTDPIAQSGRVWDSGALALGTHTLRIEPNAASNTIVIDGVLVMATDALVGVHTFNGAHSGYGTSGFYGLTGTTDEYWADIMFQPHTRVDSGAAGLVGNGTTTVTFAGASFTNDDIGEVIYAGTDTTFPRGVRIVSVTNGTTVVVNKTVPNASYRGYFTRYRLTNGTRTSGSTTFTAPATTFNQWDRGKTVVGTGIPTGTVIRRVVSDTTIILSNAATSSAAGTATLQIKNRQKYPMRPHLLMMQLGINDMQGEIKKSDFKTRMVAIETTAVEQGQLDLPTMTGIYTDESPSVMVVGLWAPAHTSSPSITIHIDTVSGSPIINDNASYSNRFTAADVGKTIESDGNSPVPAGTTILSVDTAFPGTAPGTYTRATMSANALATQSDEDARIVARVWQDSQWFDFRAALYELGVEQGWAFYDLYNLGGYIGTSDTKGLTYDLIHPNDPGAQWIADEMAMAVGGVKKLASIPQGLFDNMGEMIIAETADRAKKVPGIKKKTSADTASGTTAGVMVDISEFAFTIGPNETLSFQFWLAWTAAANTSGILFDFNPAAGVSAPADLIMGGWSANGTTGATTTGQWYGRNDAVWGTDLTIPTSISTTTLISQILISGTVTAGAIGGLITPRFGPEANAATTLQRGSWALIL